MSKCETCQGYLAEAQELSIRLSAKRSLLDSPVNQPSDGITVALSRSELHTLIDALDGYLDNA